ncbi:hypothetical protein BJ508DRAFT_321324 [Ascobolus immersus RN42]|uniref:Uncharacterized protein n=1 Tax=Ascobolus immersus RN42 TaxID=1160509 RepID=A0A3N4IMU7_ASCIM|nr:hypothetical protein BJ508DRAFT_321324 [Ascobolus immersus RN42]
MSSAAATTTKEPVPSVTSGSSSDKALRRARGLLNKVLSIKSSKGKNRASISSVTEIAGKKEETAAAPVTIKTEEVKETKSASVVPKNAPPKPPVLSSAERAKALFAKHGLEVNPSDWGFTSAPPKCERVHKEIRMRVHRNCHRCGTSFGADKTCSKCQHRRCKTCPRFPAKKPKDKNRAGHGKGGERKHRHKNELTIPSRTGGQDLVRRPIRMRVRRTCHHCQTQFPAKVKVCETCKHKRCRKCPRDPHKKNKPPGYYDHQDPEDDCDVFPPGRPRRTYKKPRRRVHWTCTKCNSTFKETRICQTCGSSRKEFGKRDPPKKPKKGTAVTGLEEALSKATI